MSNPVVIGAWKVKLLRWIRMSPGSRPRRPSHGHSTPTAAMMSPAMTRVRDVGRHRRERTIKRMELILSNCEALNLCGGFRSEAGGCYRGLPTVVIVPMLKGRSSSPRPMPLRSGPPLTRMASCQLRSSCVGGFRGAPTTRRHGRARGPSPGGRCCQRRRAQ